MTCRSVFPLSGGQKSVLQRISKERDVLGICQPSFTSSVGRGLLVAMYVEPLAAGHTRGGSVADVKVVVVTLSNRATVVGAPLLCKMVVGTLLVLVSGMDVLEVGVMLMFPPLDRERE